VKIQEFSVISILRRGLWRAAEMYFLAQVTDAFGLSTGVYASITEHFIGYVVIALTFSALYDLGEVTSRPDLTVKGDGACIDGSPMLSFEEEK
jgi:hypothetical protein